MCEMNLTHSREIERAILAILMMRPDKIAEVEKMIEPEDFFYKRDQIIFRSVYEAHAQGLPIDLVLVCHYLETKGLLQECGGATYLASLLDGLPRSEIKNLGQYCLELRQLRLLRDIQKKSYKVMTSNIEIEAYENILLLKQKIDAFLEFKNSIKTSNEGQNESALCAKAINS